MTAPLDANEVRKDFELTMVFGIEGVPCGPGGLMRATSDGVYIVPAVEHAWLGYLARAAHHHARTERLRATRSIGEADRFEVREILRKNLLTHIPQQGDRIDVVVRAILKHFEGMPT